MERCEKLSSVSKLTHHHFLKNRIMVKERKKEREEEREKEGGCEDTSTSELIKSPEYLDSEDRR